MPELPEVETVKNVLLKIVVGHTITKIDINRKSILEDEPTLFVSTLNNQTFLNITRYGKYLFFHLTNNIVLISHLRMEGKYYEINENDSDSKYARVIFHLNNGKKLCYDDSRSFGRMKLSNEANYMQEAEIAKLGKEPFAINDVSFLIKKCKNKSLPIKTTLLDQTLMTGLGNIYVDETLYASKIHPLTPAKLITKKEWETIVENAKEILNIAIEMGGSTIKSYHPGKGIDGNFQTRIKIYGKRDQICPVCGATYRFMKVNGRGTTFCPRCQEKKGKPIVVGITGKIASGKSTATSLFSKRKYDTISADQIVKELYQENSVANLLEKSLKIKFPSDKVDTTLLRNHILLNPKDKKKLERLIHPLVIKKIKTFIKESKSAIKVVEVPLLFESKMEAMFDVIIAIDINENEQDKRLFKRNGQTGEFLKEINKTNHFLEYKNKVEYLVDNSYTEKSFEKEINKIIDKLESRLA